MFKSKASTKAIKATKKAPAKKPVAKKAPAKKAPARKPAAKKAPAKKAPARKPTVRSSGSSGINLGKWYGPSRELYLPGGIVAEDEIQSYLNGSLPGDYGYDPLGLGKDEAGVEKYREFELIHARWAMLGTAGAIIPEGLQANGAAINNDNWFTVGGKMLDGGTLNYFAVPWGIIDNPIPLVAVAAIEVGLLAAAEGYRRSGAGPKGYAPGVGKFEADVFDGVDKLYPGGPFDPFNFSADAEKFEELKIKEIKNGRLAMVSALAYGVQAAVTGEGPYANWSKHVADPFGYNLVTITGPGEDYVATF